MSEEKRIFYVYILFRPNGHPCYIGKGKGRRFEKREKLTSHNIHLSRIISQAGGSLPKTIIRENLTESEAFETEIAFIKAIGREVHGGPLVNLTDGGEGPSGLVFSEASLAKIRQANLGKKRAPEVGAAISASKIGKPRFDLRGKSLSLEHRAKIGRPGIKKGPLKPETIAKMIVSRTGVKRGPQTLEHRAAISKSLIGLLKGIPKTEAHRKAMQKPKSLEHRLAIGRAHLGKKRSVEACANMKIAQGLRRGNDAIVELVRMG